MISTDKKALPTINTDTHAYIFNGSWFSLTRPLTWTGTISPIMAGTIYSLFVSQINITLFIGFLVAMLLIQASVNMLNDYFDFLNGQDKDKWRLREKRIPLLPTFQNVKYMASLFLIIAIGIGMWLAYESSFWILIAGTVGIICGIGYSFGKRSFSALGWGEIIAGVFLGIVPANLASMIQGNSFHWNLFLVSILFSLLIASMILTNNIRDIRKDAGFRKIVAIRLGKQKSLVLLAGVLVSLYVLLCLFILVGITPWQTILAVAAAPFAWSLFQSLLPTIKQSKPNYMKWAAWHHWVFSILFISGLWVSLASKSAIL